jgi:hypothetical protein
MVDVDGFILFSPAREVRRMLLPNCQGTEYEKHSACLGWAKIDGNFTMCSCPCHITKGSGN